MKKRFVYLMSAIVMTLPAAAEGFSGGDGSADSPYLIKTVADMEELAAGVSGGTTYEGKTFKMDADITYPDGSTFTSIGGCVTAISKCTTFAGTFDGNGHKISGATVTGTYFASLFGQLTSTATLKNLTIENANITSSNSYAGIVGSLYGTVDNVNVVNLTLTSTSGSYTGGLVGFVQGDATKGVGTVKNCTLSGSISSSANVGGIAGQCYGSISDCHSSATVVSLTANSSSVTLGGIAGVTLQLGSSVPAPEIKRCSFTGNITALSANTCGGIVGSLNKGTISECWNGGYLSAYGAVGGIVYNLTAGTVENCYNAGTIYQSSTSSSSAQTGGIIGFYGTAEASTKIVKSCLNFGSIFMPNILIAGSNELAGNTNPATVSGFYYDNQVAGLSGMEGGLSTESLTSGTAIDGFDSTVWTFEKGLYPRLAFDAKSDASILASTPFFLPNNQKVSHVITDFTVSTANDVEWTATNAQISGNTVKITRGEIATNVILTSYLGDETHRARVVVYPKIFGGEGTEDEPYLISSKDDLIKLGTLTNSTNNMTFENSLFKVTADIDMEYSTDFTPIAFSNETNSFNGTFDGQGHVIKNLFIDNLTEKTNNVGLFCFVGPLGTVKNLIIDKSAKFSVYRNFAPFVASCYGKVENCINYADVSPSAGFASGIVYMLQATGQVNGCLNAGNIILEGGTNLGGITSACYGAISNCVNLGTISVSTTAEKTTMAKSVGGISATALYATASLTDVVNYGQVIGATNVGGIISTGTSASGSTITRAMSFGPVTTGTSTNVGAVVGTQSNTTLTGCYYDSQIALSSATIEGVNEAETADLTSSKFVIPNAPEGTWTYVEGRYPTLTIFADNDAVKLATMPVTFASGDSRITISKSAQLYQAEGLEWSITENNALSINNNTLVYTLPASYQAATLSASYKGYTKEMGVGAVANIFDGSGSETDPYLIKTAADVVTLSNDIITTGNTYDGSFLKVTADLDFAEIKDFKGIVPDGTKTFAGTFDGDNHTIKNLSITNTDNATAGLFTIVANSGVIKNINLDSSCTVSGKGKVGSIVGTLNGKVENVSSAAKVTATTSYAGGIVGQANNGTTISGATFTGTVTGAGTYVAGIVGYAYGSSTSGKNTVENCVNSGTLTNTANGISGIGGYSVATDYINCVNYSDFSSEKNYNAGISAYSSGVYNTYTKCINYGNIKAAQYASGITAYSSTSAVTFTQCLNCGNITATTGAAGFMPYGGLMTITESANIGDVTCTNEALSTTAAGAAGFVARGDIKATDVYTVGNVQSMRSLGAFEGRYYSTANTPSVTRGYVAGNVIASPEATTSTDKIYAGVYGGYIYSTKAMELTNVYYDSNLMGTTYTATGAKTTAELTKVNFGTDAWTSLGDYCYPVLTWIADIDAVKLAAAAVVFNGEDTYSRVTTDFNVGTPAGVTWSAEGLTIEGNTVKASAAESGTYTLTATIGKLTRSYKVTVEATNGINDINVDSDDAEVEYYNLQGIRVLNPSNGIYIKRQGNKATKVYVQ